MKKIEDITDAMRRLEDLFKDVTFFILRTTRIIPVFRMCSTAIDTAMQGLYKQREAASDETG